MVYLQRYDQNGALQRLLQGSTAKPVRGCSKITFYFRGLITKDFQEKSGKLHALAEKGEELFKRAEFDLKNKRNDLKTVQLFFERNRDSCLGRRSGADRRSFTYAVYLPEKRSSREKRHNNER